MTRRRESSPRHDIFARYAEWYDLFYASKDYAAEAAYLVRKVNSLGVTPERWLDIGCGTGWHAAAIRAHGIDVQGIDASRAMIEQARRLHPGMSFQVMRAQDVDLPSRWDVVSMLFHVLSYQASADSLRRALQAAAGCLAPDGVFIFDFWHSDGMLHDPPGRRTRTVTVDGRSLHRISLPTVHQATQLVDVRYEFRWDDVDGPLAAEELHSMRAFTRTDLQHVLQDVGFHLVLCEGWMTDRPLSPQDWYGLAAARAISPLR